MKFPTLNLPTKLLISLAILLFLLMRANIEELKTIMEDLQPQSWALAATFILLQTLFLAWRWKILMNIGHHKISFISSVKVIILSHFVNTAIISSIGGIVTRITMSLHQGASLTRAVFATAADRILTLFALIFLAAIFLPSLNDYTYGTLHRDISLSILLVAMVLFALVPLGVLLISKKLNFFNLPKQKLRSIRRYLIVLINKNSLLTQTLAISLFAQLCFFIAVYCISIAAEAQLSFLQIMIVLPAISLVSSLPITVGGWGVREGAFILGLGLLGIPMETAFSISVQVGLIGLLTTAVTGIPVFFGSRLSPWNNRKTPFRPSKNAS